MRPGRAAHGSCLCLHPAGILRVVPSLRRRFPTRRRFGCCCGQGAGECGLVPTGSWRPGASTAVGHRGAPRCVKLNWGGPPKSDLKVRVLTSTPNKGRYHLSKFLIQRERLLMAQIVSPAIDRGGLAEIIRSRGTSFASQVENARVVLVGPANNGSSADMISGFDLVARVGFTGPESAPNDTGTRCDLSMYAGHHADAMAQDILEDQLVRTQIVVLRGDTNRVVAGIIQKEMPTYSERADFLAAYFRCVPNILPQFIMWILRHQPAELHITHADLFISRTYPRGYAANKPVQFSDNGFQHHRENMWRSFSWHNPFSHLEFYKWLQTQPNVSFSEQLSRIVAMSPNEYRRKLHSEYSTKEVRRSTL